VIFARARKVSAGLSHQTVAHRSTAVPWHHQSLGVDADDGTKTISAPTSTAG